MSYYEEQAEKAALVAVLAWVPEEEAEAYLEEEELGLEEYLEEYKEAA